MEMHEHFPIFIKTAGSKVIVVGGGKIAQRRIQTLAKFDFEITVLSAQITDDIQKLRDAGRICHVPDVFDPQKPEPFLHLVEDALMVLACTDDSDVNGQIGALCKSHGIQVNLCDDQKESTFWFPAIATNDELVMGLVGNGKSHETVRNAAARLRQIIEERQY